MFLSIAALVLFLVLVVWILSGLVVIRPTQRGLRERFGKYVDFNEPGLHIVFKPFSRMILVDITEKMVSAEKREVITADNLNAMVDAQIYFKIKEDEDSVKNSQYKVSSCELQIVNLARTTLRNIIGTLTLKQANSERGRINSELNKTLSEETRNWGVEIVRTELKEINPPSDVQATMNQVVKASNEKIAAIDFATARETQADGEKRAKIKEAEGYKQSLILKAEGEAESIRLVNEAAEKYFKGNAQILKQLEAVTTAMHENTKYVLSSDILDVLKNLKIGK